MRSGIMPPEYLPGQAAAALMLSVDLIVLADTYQYVRQSRQNRARLRTPDGTQWITVPVAAGQHGRRIAATRIDADQSWRSKHPKALRFNYGAAPFYEHYVAELEPMWTTRPDWLGDVTGEVTRITATVLDPEIRTVRASELPGAPGDLVSIAGTIAGGTMVAWGPAAETDAEHVEESVLLRFDAPRYRQQFPGFESDCSVWDLLFVHGPAAASILRTGIRLEPPTEGPPGR